MANSPSGLNSDPKYNRMVDILRDTMKLQSIPPKTILVTSDTAVEGQFYAITAVNLGCTFDFTDGGTDKCIVSNTSAHAQYTVDFKIPPGTTILVDWTKLRIITGGACIAYMR